MCGIFTGARLISDYLITILGGQDNEAIYRHIFIDLSTFYYPNPVYFPVGLFMRIYLKGEGDKNALSKWNAKYNSIYLICYINIFIDTW